jgi:hypothetical protein
VLYRAEFAQPTRQHPVPLVTASVYISCSRRENTVSTQKRRVWIRFEEQDYRWRLDGSVTDDGKVQWTGMGGVNPMKWLTELIRSKSQLPFDLATVSSTVVAV